MKVFVDANVILDIYDQMRPFHRHSMQAYEFLIVNAQVFTSCDVMTTIYYVNAKIDRQQALDNIEVLNKTLKVIAFSNKEMELSCKLMREDGDYNDLEDTIQYIMAKKQGCDLIISNDKGFVSKDIDLMDSKTFCDKYIT